MKTRYSSYFSQQAYEKYQYIVNKDPSFRIATLETFKETTNFKIEAVTSLGPNPKSAAIIFIRNKKNTSGLLTLGQLKISELFHPYNNKQGQAANKLLR